MQDFSVMSIFKDIVRSEGKAIPFSPALTDYLTPVTTYSPGGVARTDARLTQREAPRHMDAYGGNQAMDWVYDCVNLYAETASTADWHFERAGKKVFTAKTDNTPPDAEIAPSELVDLFTKPNPFMDYAELVELLVIDLLLVGNAYWLKYQQTSDGKPLAIYRLSPLHIKIIPSPQGPKGYEYQPPGQDKLVLSTDNVVHYRRPNPHSLYYGMGVIKGGGRPFDMELALTETETAYFENKADPSLIVQSDRRVPRDVFNKLRQQLRSRTAGPSRSGELLVLEAGLKAMTLTPSAREAMFAELSKMSRDRIFAMFRASPMLFGILDENAGAIKPTDIRREFDNKTMRPFLNKLQTRISEGIAAAWDLDFKIDYGYVIPQEDLVKLGGDFAAIPGVKVREVREFLAPLGIAGSTGDKDIDEMVLNLPGENLGPDGQPVNGDVGLADQPIGSEPGRPPKGGSAAAFPANGAPLPAGAKVRRPQGKALPPTLDDLELRLTLLSDRVRAEGKARKAPDGANVSVGNVLTNEQRPSDPLEAARVRDVDAIAVQIQKDLQDAVHVLERGLLDHSEGKAFDGKTLAKRVKSSSIWKTFQSMVAAALERGARDAISTATIHHGSQGLTVDPDADYDAMAKEIVFRSNGVREITETLRDSVVTKLGNVEDRDAADKIVRDSITAWRTGKAETIAITEATEAYNEGSLSVFENSGVTDVFVFDGHDSDQPCIDANGSIWSIDEARSRRTEHPRCRRAFSAIQPVD